MFFLSLQVKEQKEQINELEVSHTWRQGEYYGLTPEPLQDRYPLILGINHSIDKNKIMKKVDPDQRYGEMRKNITIKLMINRC